MTEKDIASAFLERHVQLEVIVFVESGSFHGGTRAIDKLTVSAMTTKRCLRWLRQGAQPDPRSGAEACVFPVSFLCASHVELCAVPTKAMHDIFFSRLTPPRASKRRRATFHVQEEQNGSWGAIWKRQEGQPQEQTK